MMIEEIEKSLLELGTNKSADFTSKIVPNSKKVMGVKVPALRKIAKKIAKGDYKYFLASNPRKYFEEDMLQALVIGYINDDIDNVLGYARDFIPTIKDWAVNDIFCQNLKITKNNLDKVWKFLEKYIDSSSEYEQRVVAVMFLSYYLTNDYIDRVLKILPRLDNDGYYAKMAVAWAVATAYCKYPDKTLKIFKKRLLNSWTHNKAINKCIDSYRISDYDKELLRSLKV